MFRSPESSGKKRIVLIDDDPIYRSIMLRFAKENGVEFDAFENLMDLGSVGMLGQYDAAIVDFDLGCLNGVEIAEYLSALFGDIPMVLISEKQREPGQNGWPPSIKRFVKKSEGYEKTIMQAKKCLSE